tara:strand:+ start:1448 stop:1594 length:147 start_codon:yes stop_codon:yes gene_type:complete
MEKCLEVFHSAKWPNDLHKLYMLQSQILIFYKLKIGRKSKVDVYATDF